MQINLKRWIVADLPKQEGPVPPIPFDLRRGDVVYVYTGPTIGCISPNGVPCCKHDPVEIDPQTGKNPFFEVPAGYLSLYHVPPAEDNQHRLL